MVDLFGLPDPAPASRKPKPVARPAAAVPAPSAAVERPETGPRFGTPEWDRCPCGGWASLFFPNAGGLRRCFCCAVAQGRIAPTPFPRWSAVNSHAFGLTVCPPLAAALVATNCAHLAAPAMVEVAE